MNNSIDEIRCGKQGFSFFGVIFLLLILVAGAWAVWDNLYIPYKKIGVMVIDVKAEEAMARERIDSEKKEKSFKVLEPSSVGKEFYLSDVVYNESGKAALDKIVPTKNKFININYRRSNGSNIEIHEAETDKKEIGVPDDEKGNWDIEKVGLVNNITGYYAYSKEFDKNITLKATLKGITETAKISFIYNGVELNITNNFQEVYIRKFPMLYLGSKVMSKEEIIKFANLFIK